MKQSTLFCTIALLVPFALQAQQTLQTVTSATNGNTTSNLIQITGVDNIRSGAGLELFRYGTAGVIQAYDRTASAPNTLRLQPNAGSITTINDAGGGRLLVNSTVDDGTTALQVRGDIKSSNGVYRALEGTLPNNILMAYGYNTTVQDYTSIKVAGVAANTAEIRLVQNGNVGIGITNPQSKLSVNGDIAAKKIKVTQTGWPDYVFQQDYKLPTLKEVEEYITINKHLQDVPSAKEVEKNGLDVGEMNKQLLQKVEELTLYLIAEHKKNIALEEKVSKLDTRLNDLECK